MKKGRQTAAKFRGQPAPRWPQFMQAAHAQIIRRGGFAEKGDTVEQIAAEIVRSGDGEAFLKSARRGRGTHRQNVRYRLLRYVETAVGAGVPRRRPDANTPDALALRDGTPEIMAEPGEPATRRRALPVPRRRKVKDTPGQTVADSLV